MEKEKFKPNDVTATARFPVPKGIMGLYGKPEIAIEERDETA